MLKIGDEVQFINEDFPHYYLNHYTIRDFTHLNGVKKVVTTSGMNFYQHNLKLIEPKGVYMFKQVGSDLKSFITDNKSVIYWVATMFLIDHLLLQGAFRERLHGLMNKMLGKAEAAMDKDMTLSVVEKKA